MNSRNTKTFFIMISAVAVILACGLPGGATQTAAPSVQDTATAPSSGEVSSPPTEPAIQHQQTPVDLPVERSSHAGDFDSSTTVGSKKSAGGDRFTFERFERPFNANTMDVYFSQLDIIDTYVFQDNTWIYGTITLKGPDANKSLTGKYALELDLDIDGRGDWLIVASNPASTDWKVDGVQVYQDANKDVGGKLAMVTDKGTPGGDGFETLVFDQGKGSDPDSAWVRVSPKDPNTIEIAVKRSVLGDPSKYMINMWAGNSLLNPSLFDISDHFTHEQAGAADIGLTNFYPIKSVFELDNSCRMAVGFQPTGQEPGLCEIFIPKTLIEVPGVFPTVPSACQRPTDCFGCGYSWDPNTCTCTHVAC